MNARDYRFLLAERATLRRLIDQTGPGEAIVRAGFQHRLRDVEAELAAYGERASRLSYARLTFRGRPVAGDRGMTADFFSDSVGEFAKAVHYIGAGQRQTPLPLTGPVPYKEDYSLLVTGVARGSFGIRVEEEGRQAPLPGESTFAELAIEELKSILEASVADDEQLANAIGEIDPRALGQVQTFLETVANNTAVCALEFRGHEFSFQDTAQVRRSADRLSADNILEDNATIDGQFLGYFPHHPRAQFRIYNVGSDFLSPEIGQIITARVAPSVASDIDINSILNRDIRINVHTRRVSAGRPRYVITAVPQDNV